jgi:hypothetical protein
VIFQCGIDSSFTQKYYRRDCCSNMDKPMLRMVVSERAMAEAELSSSVAEFITAVALSVPLVVPLPLVDDEREDEEDGGLGHRFVYTYCSGISLQAVAAPALNVLFG